MLFVVNPRVVLRGLLSCQHRTQNHHVVFIQHGAFRKNVFPPTVSLNLARGALPPIVRLRFAGIN